MISLFAYMLVGALTFSEQALDGVRVGTVRPFAGAAVVNFRHTDIDDDGIPDLVLPGKVCLQRDARFPPEARVPMPAFGRMPEVDVWAGRLYCRLPGRLAVYAWRAGAWQAELDQPVEWPGGDAPPGPNPSAVRLTRFVCDVDGQAPPEIVAAGPDGVFVYQRDGGEYVQALNWRILPELQLTPARNATVWPPEARRISLPVRQMSCRVLWQPGRISILSREAAGPRRRVHMRKDYVFAGEAPLRSEAPAPKVFRSKALPEHMKPCRLNEDGLPDFAGAKWAVSDASAFPSLVYETWASLDGGTSFAVRRAPSLQGFRPHCSFVDFDGDGDMDIVTESASLLTAGAREMLSEMLARNAIGHEIRVYVQARGRFAEAPTVRFSRTLRLEQPPFRNGPVFQRYNRAELVSILGDYNGDGYRDLAVQTERGSVAIHLASGYTYHDTPDVTLDVPPNARFGVADVNADGRGDLVFHSEERGGGAETATQTVFFAGEAAP